MALYTVCVTLRTTRDVARHTFHPGHSARPDTRHRRQAVIYVWVCVWTAETQKEQPREVELGMTRGSQAWLGSGSQLTQCQGPGTPPRDRATYSYRRALRNRDIKKRLQGKWRSRLRNGRFRAVSGVFGSISPCLKTAQNRAGNPK